MNNTSAWKNFKSTIAAPIDPWLFFAMLAIYIMSLFLLYSADGQEFGQLENKTIHTVLGFALLWIIAVFKPQTAAKVALPVYIVGVLLLIGVEVAGVTVNGSTRWLSLGFTRIQPSEIMKIGIPMTVAWYFQRYEGRLKWIHYIVALVLILVPVTLILKQPDLGTAALIMASGIFVIFFAGLPWKAHFLPPLLPLWPPCRSCGTTACTTIKKPVSSPCSTQPKTRWVQATTSSNP